MQAMNLRSELARDAWSSSCRNVIENVEKIVSALASLPKNVPALESRRFYASLVLLKSVRYSAGERHKYAAICTIPSGKY
jgi:hypothetical protein